MYWFEPDNLFDTLILLVFFDSQQSEICTVAFPLENKRIKDSNILHWSRMVFAKTGFCTYQAFVLPQKTFTIGISFELILDPFI